MHNMNHSIVVLAFFMALNGFSQEPDTGDFPTFGNITIKISGIKSDKGQVVVELFQKVKEKFPSPKGVIMLEKNKISHGMSEVMFKSVPFGTYAVTIYHDVNLNGKLDKNTLGIPKEGYGFSNNPRLFIGPPSFEAASFVLKNKELSMSISMKY